MSRQRLLDNNGIARYYQRFGSWAGYNLVMGRSQHAGYWTESTRSERQAQQNYIDKMLELLKLKKGETVLDAGSGQGYAARILARRTGATIVGITITPREVRVSEKLSRGQKSVRFVLGDYSATEFPDEYFDVIYTTESLCHAKDMAKTMREFFRILKRGGRVCFFDYVIDTRRPTPWYEELQAFLQEYAGTYGAGQQNPGQIAELMKRAGFVDIKEQDWSQYTKPTFDRLRRIAKPLAWVRPSSKLAPYFVNAVAATHVYSNLYEQGLFRYIVYSGSKV